MKHHREVSHTIHEKREIHILHFIYDIERLAAFDKVTEEKYQHNQNLLFFMYSMTDFMMLLHRESGQIRKYLA